MTAMYTKRWTKCRIFVVIVTVLTTVCFGLLVIFTDIDNFDLSALSILVYTNTSTLNISTSNIVTVVVHEQLMPYANKSEFLNATSNNPINLKVNVSDLKISDQFLDH